MSNSIAPGSSADVNVTVTALTTNQNVPAQYKTIILKKNLVNGVNTLTQKIISAANTKYVIKYDYILGENINVPDNCILEFDGGSLNNCSLVLQNTLFNGAVKLGSNLEISGTCANQTAYQSWFENNDVDAWHKFINDVDGVTTYEYENGEYNTHVKINKHIDAMTKINGNGCVLKYLFNKNNEVFYYIHPSDNSIVITNLTTKAYKGDTYVEVDDVSNFSIGDIICIHDSTHSSYAYQRDYQQGEFQTIKNIVGNKIYTEMPLYGTYRHIENSKCTVTSFHVVQVEIENITYILSNEDALTTTNRCYAINLEQTIGCICKNIKTIGFTDGLTINKSISFNVENCYARNFKGSSNTDNYGLVIMNSQNGIIEGGKYYAGNHGIAIGSSYNGELTPICRFIYIRNTESNSYKNIGGIDSHGSCEYITFENNVTTRVNGGGNFLTIINNVCTNEIIIRDFINYSERIEGNKCSRINVIPWDGVAYPDSTTENWIPSQTEERLIIANNDCTAITIYMQTYTQYPNSTNVVYDIQNNKIDQFITSPISSGLILNCVPMSDYKNITNANGYITNKDIGGTIIFKGNMWRGAIASYITAKNIIFGDNSVFIHDNSPRIYCAEEVNFYNNRIVNENISGNWRKAIILNDNVPSPSKIYITNNKVSNIAFIDALFTTTLTNSIIVISDNIYDSTDNTLLKPFIETNNSADSINLRAYIFNNKLFKPCRINYAYSVIFGYNLTIGTTKLVGVSWTNKPIEVLNCNEILVTHGTTVQRPYASNYTLYYNNTNNHLQYSNGISWNNICYTNTLLPNGSISTEKGEMPLQYLSHVSSWDTYYKLDLAPINDYESIHIVFSYDYCKKSRIDSNVIEPINNVFTLSFSLKKDENGVYSVNSAVIKADSWYLGVISDVKYIYDDINKTLKIKVSATFNEARVIAIKPKSWSEHIITELSIIYTGDFNQSLATDVSNIIDYNRKTLANTSGSTKDRPSNLSNNDIGFQYFDTTLRKPIYASAISDDTVTWVDATGATV